MTKDESLTKAHMKGRCWHGPDRKYFYIALTLILIPQIPFIVVVCKYFVQWVTAAIYVIGVFLIASPLAFFFTAAFSDPGIVPRGPVPPEDENPFAREQKLPAVKKVLLKGAEVDSKWCDTCNIYRPLRTSHCSVCNNCVDKFDHHCPWIGNCVGRRNYRYFLLFIYSLTVDCLFIIILSVVYIVLKADDYNALIAAAAASVTSSELGESQSTSSFHYAMDQSAYFAIILPVYAVGGFCFVGGLAGFHCYLTAGGVTTNEYVKKSYKVHPNPHSAGVFRNFIRTFCGPFYPSFVTLRYAQNKGRLYALPSGSVVNANANVTV